MQLGQAQTLLPSHAAASASRRARAVRARWEQLPWTAQLGADALVLPEAHYLDLAPLGLSTSARAALNRLLGCFTCELFIHFEAYVIEYLERHPDGLPGLPPHTLARFVDEERVHSAMFARLLHSLDPARYPALASGADPRSVLRWLRWTGADARAVRLAPTGAFFLLAWLFEEITLFVPEVIQGAPNGVAPLAAAVMELHAREERAHVALDARVLARRPASRLRRWLDTAMALGLLVYVDRKVTRASRALVQEATRTLVLTPGQAKALLRRGPTASDRLGTESFAAQLAASPIASLPTLARVLRGALSRAVRRVPAAP
jgi:hypothetical protein